MWISGGPGVGKSALLQTVCVCDSELPADNEDDVDVEDILDIMDIEEDGRYVVHIAVQSQS